MTRARLLLHGDAALRVSRGGVRRASEVDDPRAAWTTGSADHGRADIVALAVLDPDPVLGGEFGGAVGEGERFRERLPQPPGTGPPGQRTPERGR